MAIPGKYCMSVHWLAVSLIFGCLVLASWRVESQEMPAPNAFGGLPPMTFAPGDLPLLWRKQRQDAASALRGLNYAAAELNCADALKTADHFDPAAMQKTASLVLMAEIYQAESKSNLAEQTFLTAIAGHEKAMGTNDSGLVMPLENLARFYYFAEHRYDLATPVSLRILHLVETNSPRDDAEVERRALAVAVVYRLQGRYAEAEPFYKEFLDLAGTNGDADLREDLLATATFYHDWGKFDQAEIFCQRALVLAETASANGNAESQMQLAVSLYDVAENYRLWGQLDHAEPLYRESLKIIQKNTSAGDSDLARPLSGLAATLAAQGKTNAAAALYQQAFTLAQASLGPEDVLVKSILRDYSTLLEDMNLPDQAQSVQAANQWQTLIGRSQQARHVNALEAAEQMAGEARDIARNFQPADTRLGKTQVQLAEIYRQQNKTNEAEAAYATAVASFEKAVGTNNLELITPLEYEADFYYTTKVQYNWVVTIYLRILNIIGSQPDQNLLELAHWQRNLADVYRLQGKAALAEASYLQALATAASGTNSVDDQVQYLQLLADFYQAGGRGGDAEQMARQALIIRELAAQLHPGNDAQLGIAASSDLLAQIYLAQNKPAEAEMLYTRSLTIAEKIQGPQSSGLLPRLVGLAAASRAQKKFKAAEIQYQQALGIAETNAPNAASLPDVLEKYAGLLQDMNRMQEAKLMLARADIMRGQAGPDAH